MKQSYASILACGFFLSVRLIASYKQVRESLKQAIQVDRENATSGEDDLNLQAVGGGCTCQAGATPHPPETGTGTGIPKCFDTTALPNTVKECEAFQTEAEIEQCVGPTLEPTVWIVGDSHSRQLKQTFARATSQQVTLITWDGDKCPLSNIEGLLGRLMKSSDLFVYARRYWDWEQVADKFAAEAKVAVKIAKSAGMPLVFLGDNPSFSQPAQLCRLNAEKTGASESPCAKDKKEVVNIQLPFTTFYEGLTKTSNVYYFDYSSLLCPGDKCDIYIPGTKTVAMRDDHHLNDEAAHFLAPWMCSFLKSKGLTKFADLHKAEV